MISPNWIEIEAGRQLRSRIQQRTDWLRATGQDHSTERLARDLDRSASTIARHLRIDAGRTKKNPQRELRASDNSSNRTKPNMTDHNAVFKGFCL